jgi:hypothetical protein
MTSKWVSDQIIAKEHHRIAQSGGGMTTFFAKAKKGKPSNRSNNSVKCMHCKKQGHKKADCYKLKREKEEKEAAANGTSTGNTNANASKSSSSRSNSTSAKIAVPSPLSTDNTVRLFCALTIPCPTPVPAPAPIPVPIPAPPPTPTIKQLHTTCEHILQAQAKSGSGNLTDGWIIDSSASWNMCAHHDWFHHYSPLSSPIDVVLGDDSSIQASGVGCISVHMQANGQSMPVVLQDVLHVPELHRNLLSVLQFAQCGTEMYFVREGCCILDQCKQVACEGNLWGNLYVMHITTITTAESARLVVLNSFPAEGEDPPETVLLMENSTLWATIDTWHHRLGHLNTDNMLCMVHKGLVKGMEITGGNPSSTVCEPCLKGKQTHAEIQKETETHADTILG